MPHTLIGWTELCLVVQMDASTVTLHQNTTSSVLNVKDKVVEHILLLTDG